MASLSPGRFDYKLSGGGYSVGAAGELPVISTRRGAALAALPAFERPRCEPPGAGPRLLPLGEARGVCGAPGAGSERWEGPDPTPPPAPGPPPCPPPPLGPAARGSPAGAQRHLAARHSHRRRPPPLPSAPQRPPVPGGSAPFTQSAGPPRQGAPPVREARGLGRTPPRAHRAIEKEDIS